MCIRDRKESVLKIYHLLSTRADLTTILTNMSTHQQADPKSRNLRLRLEEGDETVTMYYQMNKQILFIKISLKEEVWKVVVPTQIEKELIVNYHIRYGHMGALKVIKALEESCYIKNINRKVRMYIKSCRLYTSRCV